MIRRAKIAVSSCGLFDFDEGGKLAEIAVARHENWDPADYVAWYPDDPARWWAWRSMIDIAGAEVLHIHRRIDRPVPIWRTPMTWAAHHGHGVCALSWPAARLTLADVTLIAEDPAHAHEIQWQFQRPQPRVLLRAPKEAAV